jgi:2-polyprenyl-3-methyl-5-hydroxy-6-metoxy-1,4-benzoquinol methylase
MSNPSSSPSLEFRFRGTVQRTAYGSAFNAPAAKGFTDTSISEAQAIIAAIRAGRPWRDEIVERFSTSRPWLHDIVLSPKRSAFLESTIPPGTVLDIGCGWGQLTLPLAKRGNQVVSLEPMAERIGFVQAVAAQERCSDHIAFVGADYFECEFEAIFATILSIGVFEWAGAFQTREDPQTRQRHFLQKTRRELAPGGALIIGIENRLGLKYLLGCPDDHLGVAGIGFLSAELAARRWREKTGQPLLSFTYSDVELIRWLHDAGFTTIEFHAALPDYKLPEVVIPLSDAGDRFNREILAGLNVTEHNGYNGERLAASAQAELADAYRSLAAQGIAHHFAPSFFVKAS